MIGHGVRKKQPTAATRAITQKDLSGALMMGKALMKETSASSEYRASCTTADINGKLNRTPRQCHRCKTSAVEDTERSWNIPASYPNNLNYNKTKEQGGDECPLLT